MDAIRNLINDLNNGMSIEELSKTHDAKAISLLDRDLGKAIGRCKVLNVQIRNKAAYYRAKLGVM
jgi:hypothetical protein